MPLGVMPVTVSLVCIMHLAAWLWLPTPRLNLTERNILQTISVVSSLKDKVKYNNNKLQFQ